MNKKPTFLPGIAGVDVPVADVTPINAAEESSNGPLAGLTKNYSLNLVNFDWITWHDYEWDNWITVDALLQVAIGFLNIVGVWRPQTDYTAGQTVFDPTDLNVLWLCELTHTSGTQFDQAEKDAYWTQRTDADPPVTSVFGRIGDVVGVYGDYTGTLIQIDPTNLSYSVGTNTQLVLEDIDAALRTVDDEVDGLLVDALLKPDVGLQTVLGEVQWDSLQHIKGAATFTDQLIPIRIDDDGTSLQASVRFRDKDAPSLNYFDAQWTPADSELLFTGPNAVQWRMRDGWAVDTVPTDDDAVMRRQWAELLDALRMRWMNEWSQQTYEANDMVRDGDWLMVANKQTSDRPAPILSQGPLYLYAGTEPTAQIIAKQTTMGQRYTNTSSEWLSVQGFRAWTIVGNSYRAFSIAYPGTEQEHIKELFNWTGTKDGWTDFGIAEVLVEPGGAFDIVVTVTEPDPVPTVTTLSYNYTTPNNASVPAAGQISHANKATSEFRVHKTDQNGDQSAVLGAMTVGDIIDDGNVRWSIQSVTDNGTWINFGIAPATQTAPDGVRDFTFESTAAAPITYLKDDDYYLSSAGVQGLFGADVPYDTIVPDETAYGVDLFVGAYTFSDDWDLAAHSSGNGSGGGIGAASFVDLNDTPANYAGASAGQAVIINQTVDGLEFGAASGTVSMGATLPSSPVHGDQFYLTIEPVGMYIYVDENVLGTGTSAQWVQQNGGGTVLSGFVEKTGDTMSGDLIVDADVGANDYYVYQDDANKNEAGYLFNSANGVQGYWFWDKASASLRLNTYIDGVYQNTKMEIPTVSGTWIEFNENVRVNNNTLKINGTGAVDTHLYFAQDGVNQALIYHPGTNTTGQLQFNQYDAAGAFLSSAYVGHSNGISRFTAGDFYATGGRYFGFGAGFAAVVQCTFGTNGVYFNDLHYLGYQGNQGGPTAVAIVGANQSNTTMGYNFCDQWSDVSLKMAVQPASSSLAAIQNINIISFEWGDDILERYNVKSLPRVEAGFDAQQLETVFPDMVNEVEFSPQSDIAESKSSEVRKIVNSKLMIPHLVKAIQELTERLEALENKNA